MKKLEKRAQAITEKIKKITSDKTAAVAVFSRRDNSVQAELRLEASWNISYPVDEIGYPKNLAGDYNNPLWLQMRDIASAIRRAAALKTGRCDTKLQINERTKTGPERRAEAKNNFIIEAGNAFLADYRAVTGKRAVAAIRKTITDLQAQQKALLPQLRAVNAAYLAGKKTEKQAQADKNAEALKSGRFWDADKETLKGYFHPPFDKNYLADVSEKWRAALFLECKSVSFKTYSGSWGHKLAGTGRGFLCGIDDNGDEWGHRANSLPQSHDQFGDAGLDSTVEEAMAELFDISKNELAKCYRQGDLLFCPAPIPPETKMIPAEKWAIRESHELWSPGLNHNGTYFKSNREILVSHTSHADVILPPGEYELHELEIEGQNVD